MSDRLQAIKKIIQAGGATFVGTADNTVTLKDPNTGRKICVFGDVLRSAADVKRILRERRMMQSGTIQ